MSKDPIKLLSFDLVRKGPAVVKDVLGLEPLSLRSEAFRQLHDRLLDQWYSGFSTAAEDPRHEYDFSVYSDPLYPHLMLDCYRGWSRITAVNAVTFARNMQWQPRSVIDIFAGLGQTTIILAHAFPDAEVLYHNIDPAQTRVFRRLCELYDVRNARVVTEPEPTELVFAMEAIEHVLDPMAFLTPLLTPKQVKVYIDGSSFGIDSIGHFPRYMHGDEVILNTDYKRFFFIQLQKLGYFQSFQKERFVHPRFYNGRPNVLVREGAFQ